MLAGSAAGLLSKSGKQAFEPTSLPESFYRFGMIVFSDPSHGIRWPDATEPGQHREGGSGPPYSPAARDFNALKLGPQVCFTERSYGTIG